MKKIFFSLFIVSSSFFAGAQVPGVTKLTPQSGAVVGSFISGAYAVPAASAIIEGRSTTKGFLAPRMTTTQRNAIASPATGLMIYNTSVKKFNYYTGTYWAAIDSGTVTSLNNGLTLTGGVGNLGGTLNRNTNIQTGLGGYFRLDTTTMTRLNYYRSLENDSFLIQIDSSIISTLTPYLNKSAGASLSHIGSEGEARIAAVDENPNGNGKYSVALFSSTIHGGRQLIMLDCDTNPGSLIYVQDSSNFASQGLTGHASQLIVTPTEIQLNTSNIYYPTGASNGFVLTSDNLGNGSWQSISSALSILNSYANDAAAAGGGVPVGGAYYNTTIHAYTKRES